MAVYSKEDFKEALRVLFGERTDDEAMTMLENFTDTYDELSKPLDDYENRYNDLLVKYRNRFFATDEVEEKLTGDDIIRSQQEDIKTDDDSETTSFEELFEERKEKGDK